MRKINLTAKKLRYVRSVMNRVSNFRKNSLYGSFLRKKKRLFSLLALKNRFQKVVKGMRVQRPRAIANVVKANRFYKMLIKNTQFMRQFYGDMKDKELRQLNLRFFKRKNSMKKYGGLNLIYNLDMRLNSYLFHN